MRDFGECRAFVEHLRLEHQQIHEAVGDAENRLLGEGLVHENKSVQQSLERLRETLSSHFEAEEQGGCLEEAVSYAPGLANEVASIEGEHGTILKLLSRLIERTDDCDTVDFREAFSRFAKILRHHETTESRVLQTAFGTGAIEDYELPYSYGD